MKCGGVWQKCGEEECGKSVVWRTEKEVLCAGVLQVCNKVVNVCLHVCYMGFFINIMGVLQWLLSRYFNITFSYFFKGTFPACFMFLPGSFPLSFRSLENACQIVVLYKVLFCYFHTIP